MVQSLISIIIWRYTAYEAKYAMGDGNVDDRRMEVLMQYDLTIKSCSNSRGALMLETDNGLKLLRPCTSGEQRLEFEDLLKQYIRNQGGLCVDTVCRTKEGKLFAENSYGDRFCIRDWYYGEECSLKEVRHCLVAVDTLNCFQELVRDFPIGEGLQMYERLPLAEQFSKRIRELKKVRSYIREKKQKNEFEVYYLKLCDGYYEQALAAEEYIMSQCSAAKEKLPVHGNFSYHSLLAETYRESELFVLTAFDKAGFGQQISDFYYLLRKTMEKNEWDKELGERMILRYLDAKENPEEECRILKAQLMFPEKFWKIANYYFNNRKSWVPQKNIKKMFSNHDREPRKAEFIKAVF